MSLETDVFGFSGSADRINSKRKGNVNEGTCCKAMKSWTGYKFVRVPMSGGLRWKDSQNVAADLICDEPDVEFRMTVETKHLKKITISRVLKTNSMVFTIWEQVMSDAMRCGKLPMAMLRENGMDSGEYYCILASEYGGALMSLNVPILFSGGNGKYNIIGFKFSDVKQHMKYARFDREIVKYNLVTKFTAKYKR